MLDKDFIHHGDFSCDLWSESGIIEAVRVDPKTREDKVLQIKIRVLVFSTIHQMKLEGADRDKLWNSALWVHVEDLDGLTEEYIRRIAGDVKECMSFPSGTGKVSHLVDGGSFVDVSRDKVLQSLKDWVSDFSLTLKLASDSFNEDDTVVPSY